MRVIRFFAVIAISLLLAACAQTKTVTVTEYRDRVVTDTVEKLRVDSVYVSRWIKQKGDTIILHDTIFKYRVLHDTDFGAITLRPDSLVGFQNLLLTEVIYY